MPIVEKNLWEFFGLQRTFQSDSTGTCKKTCIVRVQLACGCSLIFYKYGMEK